MSILGTPHKNDWPEGLKQAKKRKMKLKVFRALDLKQLIPQASKQAIDLLKSLLAYDPKKRPTAEQVLKYPFFTDYEEELIRLSPKKRRRAKNKNEYETLKVGPNGI
jgi:serine/threonine protein kinase